MSKVLVTGAAGFIGSQLVEKLLSRGDEVRALVRSQAGRDRLGAVGARIVEGDVTARASLVAAVADVDTVYHLAGLTRAMGMADFLRVNEQGVANLLDVCGKQLSPPTVVLVSSLAAAGPSVNGAARTEDQPPRPVSNYGRSKLAGERVAATFSLRLPITIVRPPIVLGPGDRVGLTLFKMVDRAGLHLVPGLAPARFSVIHVDDLTTALILAAERGNRLPGSSPPNSSCDCADRQDDARTDPRGYYFVASESMPTYGELGCLVGQALGRRRTHVIRFPKPIVWPIATCAELTARLRGRAPYVGIDKAREALAGDWICSSERAQRELGFTSAAPLPDRLSQTAAWYREAGWL